MAEIKNWFPIYPLFFNEHNFQKASVDFDQTIFQNMLDRNFKYF